MSTAKFNTWQNPDGTENYKCRAWVNFNGTGTVAIRAAGNVSSITDNGTGDYTVNLTSALVDSSFAVVIGSANETSNSNSANNITPLTPSTFKVQHVEGGASADTTRLALAVFR